MMLHSFEIVSLPEELDLKGFVDAMLGSPFMICHDLKEMRTLLVTEDSDAIARLKARLAGIDFKETEQAIAMRFSSYFVGYAEPQLDKEKKIQGALSDLYMILRGTDSRLIVFFTPAGREHVESVRSRIEGMASSKGIRLTKSASSRSSIGTSDSMQMELFYESDERRMLLSLLETLNDASMKNGAAYNVSLVIDGDARLHDYIKSRLFTLEERKISLKDSEQAYAFAMGHYSLPFSHANAAGFLVFSGRIERRQAIMTQYHGTDGDIHIGEYLHGSLTGTGESLCLDRAVLNLGTIISGLPGTGKTMTAMRIVKQLAAKQKSGIVVISPTGEWNAIGNSMGLKVVRVYENHVRINFFKCDSGTKIERFYENLAMLVSYASGAGPYTKTMEKCLLSAFGRVYSSTAAPDPAYVYDEIENAVIEQHGKRSNAGVKFTKHGENTMAALQNLRLMLMKPQFAYPDGIDFSELIEQGVIFDLSRVSNSMKPFFYALILNQIYSFAEMLDEKGNDELRMLICAEEAQLMLDSDEESAATLDLGQRIQDFRKKGVGLMLIAHSATDISLGIRRLCQNKFYFRQSADSAKCACADLIFREEEGKLAVERLKSMRQGVCAVSYVTIEGRVRIPNSSVFVSALHYELEAADEPKNDEQPSPIKQPTTRIKILDQEEKPKTDAAIELLYVGERVFKGRTDKDGVVIVEGLMQDREYRMLVIGEKKRETKVFKIAGGRERTLSLDILTK